MINFFKKEKKKPENLEEILSDFNKLEKKFEKVSRELESLKEKSKFSVQRVKVVRFNPFSEVGSNQSFCVVLLDDNNDGVIITSLYTREGNRVYGKSIEKGISQYPLSDEEKKALEEATKTKEQKNNNGNKNNS